MYKEILGAKEINISHDISDRNTMRKERLRGLDSDIYLKALLRLRTEKG